MKKHLKMTLLLSFVFVMVVAACTSAPAATQPAVEITPMPPVEQATPVVQEPAATEVPAVVKLTDAEMQAMLEQKLIGSPHTLEFILSQEKNAEEWDKTITRMIGNGAKINAEEKQMLIDWLVSRK